jgi:HEAT repeat protein
VEPLIEALSHSIEVVRGNAAGALGEIKDPRAVEPLISALRDYVPHVRLMAAGALAAISDPRAIGPLAKQLEHEQDNDVRNSLTEAITKLESENVPEP